MYNTTRLHSSKGTDTSVTIADTVPEQNLTILMYIIKHIFKY